MKHSSSDVDFVIGICSEKPSVVTGVGSTIIQFWDVQHISMLEEISAPA